MWPIDRTLKDTTPPSLSGPESNGDKGILDIPQSTWTVASPSDSLESYLGHLLRESYPSAKI